VTEAFPTLPPPPPLRIAIVGAESSGKTTLAADLAAALAGARPAASAASPAPRVALVPEVLREWCDARGRTPRRDEQHGILVEQHRRIEAAAAAHDIVVCDTTALMTHVYSSLLFDDDSLLEAAVVRHRAMAVTLLTALDLPWVADGHQRDGEHVRQPVDDRLRDLLHRHGMPFSVVAGRGAARLAQAMAALRPVLRAESPGRPAPATGAGAARPPGHGLFSRLLDEPAGEATAGATADPRRAGARARRDWVCDCCVPEAERALMRARRDPRWPEGGSADERVAHRDERVANRDERHPGRHADAERHAGVERHRAPEHARRDPRWHERPEGPVNATPGAPVGPATAGATQAGPDG